MTQGQIGLDSLVKQEGELSFEAKLTRLPSERGTFRKNIPIDTLWSVTCTVISPSVDGRTNMGMDWEFCLLVAWKFKFVLNKDRYVILIFPDFKSEQDTWAHISCFCSGPRSHKIWHYWPFITCCTWQGKKCKSKKYSMLEEGNKPEFFTAPEVCIQFAFY